MIAFLSNTRTLWISFLATLALTLSFALVQWNFSMDLVDSMSDPDIVRETIRDLSPSQKTAHIWTTTTLDVAYPLAYSTFFMGMALRFFGRLGPLLALPALFAIPLDLVEGVVQVMALTGNDSLIWAKRYLTPAKYTLAYAGLAIAVLGLVLGIVRRNQHTT